MAFLNLSLPLLILSLFITTRHLTHAQTTQQQFLEVHNMARAQVGVAPLVWNHTLAAYAQRFADKVKVTCDNTEESKGPYGENTVSGYGAFTIIDAVSQWVEERPNYDHKMNRCDNGMECRHYIQVVWRKSVNLGCASVVCGAGWPFVVCEYFPRGNIEGQWPY